MKNNKEEFRDIDSILIIVELLFLFYNFEYYSKNFYKKLLVFDQDSKMMGFYVPTLDKNGESENYNEKSSGSNVLLIICIIVLFVGLIALAYYLGKKINEKRKQRANELEDDGFDYKNKDNNLLYNK